MDSGTDCWAMASGVPCLLALPTGSAGYQQQLTARPFYLMKP